MLNHEKLLRAAFLVGAVTNALAILPMLIPSLGKFLWGFSDASTAYRFAVGYAASLMLGWTALLIWAFQRPVERRAVAAFTILVICGLVITGVLAALCGHLASSRMVSTWCLQAMLLGLFATSFHSVRVKRLQRRD